MDVQGTGGFLKSCQDFWNRHTKGSSSNRILGASLMVAMLLGMVKGGSLVKELAVAYAYGTGDALDAYLIAFLIPSFIVAICSGGFNSAVTPTYIRLRDKSGPAAAQDLLSGILVLNLGLMIVVTGIMMVLGPYLLPFLGSGFHPDKLALCQKIYFCFVPVIFFGSYAKIFSAIIMAGKKFALATISEIAVPIVTIIFILAFESRLGIYALAFGFTLGLLINCFILLYSIRKSQVKISFRWFGFTPEVKEIISQFWPLLVGQLILVGTTFVDQGMAAMLPSGSVASLSFGSKIPNTLNTILGTAFGAVLLPYLSGMVSRENWSDIAEVMKKKFWLIMKYFVPMTLVLMALSEFITQTLFERGGFVASDTVLVSAIQVMYFIGVPFALIKVLGLRLVHALRLNWIAMVTAGVVTVLNIVLNLILMGPLGISGIALATSITEMVALVMIFGLLKSKAKFQFFNWVILGKPVEDDHLAKSN